MGSQRRTSGGNDMNYIFEQFYVSTADDELNYFTRIPRDDVLPSSPPSPLPAGIYRVIAGQLYRIKPGVPPSVDEATEPS